MADRVHPREEEEEEHMGSLRPRPSRSPSTSPRRPPPEKPVSVPVTDSAPPSGTYVIQIPKDQIYRVPPPENAIRYKHLSRPKSRKTRVAYCCRCFFCTLFAFILLLAIAAAIFYFVFRPESPDYTLDNLSITSFNLTSPSSSPQFDLTLTARNPNDKISIYYQKGSSVNVYYEKIDLCNAALPQFYQPSNNVTVLKTTALKSSSAIELTDSAYRDLLAAETNGRVPLRVTMKAAVKFKVGSVKSWSMNVKVRCDVSVDKLTAESKIVSKDCHHSVDVW